MTTASTAESLPSLLGGLSGVDQVGLEARAAALGTRSIKTTSKQRAIDLAISMVDLTTLEGSDTPGKVRALANKAMHPDSTDATCPSAAAVCVYPDMVAVAKQTLGSSGVRVASVATAFPSGRAALDIKLAASRKDARDAVRAARAAFGGWAGRTPYSRGQVLYRIAEVMEDRHDQFVRQVRVAEGLTAKQGSTIVDTAVDRVVWYAGWADKYTQVLGNANAVSSPFFNLSSPEPTGVVAVLAPQDSLLGLVSTVLPAIATGNTVVVVGSKTHPIAGVTLAEVMATSDLPGGVVNLLTGSAAEIGPWLASHLDVNGIDLVGTEGALAVELEVASAENLKRVLRPTGDDWLTQPSLQRLAQWTETKTVWHPIGI